MPKYRVKRHLVTQPSDPSYKLIPLTQGQNAIVDAKDFEWLSQWNWYAYYNPHTKSFYAKRRAGDNDIGMHGAILNCEPSKEVDHKSGNTLDNRRANIRVCTHTENMRNRGKDFNTRSGFKGVYRDKKKWFSQISVNGKAVRLGIFTDKKKAAKAYDQAATIYHGEFARFNFPRRHGRRSPYKS